MPVALAAVLAVFVMGQMPASAHYTTVNHGKVLATTSDDHMRGSVCDQEVDGNAVEAFWYPSDGGAPYYEIDGGDKGCDTQYFSVPVYAVAVCEQTKPNCYWSYTH